MFASVSEFVNLTWTEVMADTDEGWFLCEGGKMCIKNYSERHKLFRGNLSYIPKSRTAKNIYYCATPGYADNEFNVNCGILKGNL